MSLSLMLSSQCKRTLNLNDCILGSQGGGDDAQRDGARQVGVLSELPFSAQLDADSGETHRANRSG